MERIDRRGVRRWPAALAVAATLCACAPRFAAPVAPTAPPVPAPDLPRATQVPVEPERVERTDVASAPQTRLGPRSVVAIGPLRLGEKNIAPELLRRLLARAQLRILDLTGMDRLTAEITSPGGSDGLTVSGPLVAVLWGARVGSASYVLVADDLVAWEIVTEGRTTSRFEPEALASYEAARAGALRDCETIRLRAGSLLRTYQDEFARAEARHRDDRPFLVLWSDPELEREHRGAREQHDRAVAALTDAGARCASLGSTLPSVEDLRARESTPAPAGEIRRTRATGSFRLVEVPGGRLVWTALLGREGATSDEAVAALLDALVESLPMPPAPAARRGGGR